MAVYVDDMRAPFGRMIMCHMYADTHEELMHMARRIGMRARWLQHPGDAVKEHFDVCLSRRAKAVKLGAIETTWRDYGRWAGRRRAHMERNDVATGT